ncbi:hypothetical protein [Lysinibacter sp. HNR]|uniref:hypothetical protein n=1 Tax=Lysinibacter sp. HNR TaxID=3031408 RepID=UPI0024349C2C|nr:hypothetical protein [Lysinibacter sp. HNR]WGD37703.1 hypothetical protein FrondiHNR_01965 [Lysinibacter sp. HNR]
MKNTIRKIFVLTAGVGLLVGGGVAIGVPANAVSEERVTLPCELPSGWTPGPESPQGDGGIGATTTRVKITINNNHPHIRLASIVTIEAEEVGGWIFETTVMNSVASGGSFKPFYGLLNVENLCDPETVFFDTSYFDLRAKIPDFSLQLFDEKKNFIGGVYSQESTLRSNSIFSSEAHAGGKSSWFLRG